MQAVNDMGEERSNVQCKDRARAVKEMLLARGEPLGVWDK
jgi:hypothetical protein